MAGATKIATCCYCGTRAMMRLGGKVQHELVCSNCGAPLHALKWLKEPKPAKAKPKTRPAPRPGRYDDDYRHRKRQKPRKRRKGLFHKAFEELFDVVEDIFD